MRTRYNTPIYNTDVASSVLFLVSESVEFSSQEQELNSGCEFALVQALNHEFYEKRREVECIYQLEALDCPIQINTNNSRPIRPFAFRQIAKTINHVAKRCGKPKPVADVSVRLTLYIWKLSRFLAENKRKPYFQSKYRLIRCQNMSFEKKQSYFRLSKILRLIKRIVNHCKILCENGLSALKKAC